MIVSDITSPFLSELFRGFESSALAHRFDTLLCDTNYSPRRAEADVRMLIEKKVRGVAVMTSELPPHLIEDFTANHVAVVSLDLGTVGPYAGNIRVDYACGIRQAIDHLRKLGHADIALVSGPKSLQSACIRREAFVTALHAYGLSAKRTVEGDHKVDGGMAAARILLRQRRFPTAILCSNDLDWSHGSDTRSRSPEPRRCFCHRI